MNFVKNVLAVIGLCTIIGAVINSGKPKAAEPEVKEV